MTQLIIELHTGESCSAFNTDGSELSEDVLQDFLDCTASGDCQDACEYVLTAHQIDWRIVKRVNGEFQNVTASAEDKAELCRTIYFESDQDFTDEDTAELCLVWEAAHSLRN